MRRVFLSHSSNDKGYVRKVVEKVGIDNCVYDEYTFEAGMDTLEEIFKGLESSDLFVIFISDSSLESKWVKKEIKGAKDFLNANQIIRIYPIIVDGGISYDDTRIPQWMKETYNIRYIASPNIAANKIKARLREIVWNCNPRLKSRSYFFVGRNEEVKRFEDRRSDFDLPELKCINASGLDEMGRKAFMSYVLKKGNIMNASYEYNLISLDKHESIEDFILKIADLGNGGITATDLSLKTQEEKISVAASIINTIGKHNEFIFINDQGVIIRPNLQMVEWFRRVLEQVEKKLIIGIASIYSLHNKAAYSKNDYRDSLGSTFSILIKELDVSERKLLLKEYCRIERITIPSEKLKTIANNLSGYPGQIFYAVQMIKDEGIDETLDKLYQIREYADLKAQVVFDRFVQDDDAISFLVFLSSFDFVNYDILDIVFIKHPNYRDYLYLFVSVSICEKIGSDGEYIRVNDVLKDIVFRRRLEMTTELKELFNSLVNQTVNDSFVNETDLASYYSVIRSKFENGDIDEKYIIPSHYLKCIVKNYNSRFYEKSSKLCKQLIDGGSLSRFDKEIANDIYYYYCQSLAREHKQDKFFQEIDYPGFNETDKQFLLGFFFRINGNPQKAIEHLKKAINSRADFPKARRELANAYLAAEDYEEAERLCVENYQKDNRNPYYIQPYFESLIHKNDFMASTRNTNIIQKMEELLEAMRASDSPQAKQMYCCMKAEYYAYVKNEYDEAMFEIQEGLNETVDSSIYLLLTKFDIAYRFLKTDEMDNALKDIERIIQKQSYFLNALNIRKARYYSATGQFQKANSALCEVKNMPQNAMRKIQKEITQL